MVTQRIKLDFQTGAVQPRLHASQFDTGERVFIIECFYGRTPYIIPEGASVVVSGRKPGNTVFLRDAEFEENVVTLDCVRTMTDIDGYVKCELIIATGDGVASSANFVLLIEPSVVKSEDLPESDYQAIQELVEEAKKASADKQDVLTPGANITIVKDPDTGETIISSTGGGGGETYTAGRGINITADNEIETTFDPEDLVDYTTFRDALADKQKILIPSDDISIDSEGNIELNLNRDKLLEMLELEEIEISKTDENGVETVAHLIGYFTQRTNISYSTVLYSDGTLIINERDTQREHNEETHDGVYDVWETYADAPWRGSISEITSVEVDSSIKPASMKEWFAFGENIRSFELGNIDTSECTDMTSMFEMCENIEQLNLSNFDFSNVTKFDRMFYACPNLTTIYVDSPNLQSAESGNDMFSMDSNLVGGGGTQWASGMDGIEYARVDNPPGAPGFFTQV